jgi:hypothetical protein
MALFKRGGICWYEFLFAGRRIRESAKMTSKTVAKLAEQNRRRELEGGFNGIQDKREERIRSVRELGDIYLDDYRLRHKSIVYAEYALGNVILHLGPTMAVDVTEQTVTAYQTARLKEGAAPKTINEEVGFLLRLLGAPGYVMRARLRRKKLLKLAVPRGPGKEYTPEEKAAMLDAAKRARAIKFTASDFPIVLKSVRSQYESEERASRTISMKIARASPLFLTSRGKLMRRP